MIFRDDKKLYPKSYEPRQLPFATWSSFLAGYVKRELCFGVDSLILFS